MSRTARQAAGENAENQACDYLQQQGLELLERNYRCRQGEIDLIMRDGAYTVFVEVRYRRNTGFGSGAETVDNRKQQKLISAASLYLQQHRRLAQQPARFDVVSMSRQADTPQIEWIRDAFQIG
jgi:putative endonuclease